MKETCVFCGKSTDLICDATIGFEWVPEEGSFDLKTRTWIFPRVVSVNGEMLTCDMPICKKCRSKGNPIFYCGSRPSIFVPDLCPLHKEAPSLGTLDGHMIAITREEVTEWRKRSMMLISGGKMRSASPYPQLENERITKPEL